MKSGVRSSAQQEERQGMQEIWETESHFKEWETRKTQYDGWAVPSAFL